MTRRNFSGKKLLITLMVTSFVVDPAIAQEMNAAEAASLANRIGVSATDAWLRSGGFVLPSSKLEPLERSAAIERGLERYEAIRNGYGLVSGVGAGMEVGAEALVGGALLYAGPQATATVPLTLAGGAALMSLKLTNDSVEAEGQQTAQTFLEAFAGTIASEAGIDDLAAFSGRPEELRAMLNTPQFREGSRLLADVRRRAADADDEDLLDLAIDMIARQGAAMDTAALSAAEATSVDLDDLEQRFGNFVVATNRNLERTEEALDAFDEKVTAIQGDVARLDGQVAVMTREVSSLGANQDLLADFVFSSQPPAEKARMLRQGLLDRRIVCPEAEPDCDRVAVRDAMIERYETDARIVANVALAGEVLQGISNTQQIAADLNIPLDGTVGDAMRVAGGALNAYMSVMTGNYLGAIASVTGMFGSKPDPEAERFKIMMAYLQKQFGIINEKLDSVLENQQIIHEAVVAVSDQLRATHQQLDGRLAAMQWMQVQVDRNVKQLIWDDWKSCEAIYRIAVDPAPGRLSHIDPATSLFRSFAALDQTVQEGGNSVEDCMQVFRENRYSLANVPVFGNFLSASAAMSPEEAAALPDAEIANLSEAERALVAYKDEAQLFREQVVSPATTIVLGWAARNGVGDADLLQLQAGHIEDVNDLDGVLALVGTDWSFSCPDGGLDVEDVSEVHSAAGLLCYQGREPGAVATGLVTEALSVDVLLDISDWITVLAPIADTYQFNPQPGQNRFARTLPELATRTNPPYLGKILTRNMIDLTTLGISFQNRVYGGLTAHAVAEDIYEGRADARHRILLSQNPYLSENVAMLIMSRTRGEVLQSREEQSGPGLEPRYVQAIVHGRSDADYALEPLSALFDDQLQFATNDEGRAVITLDIDGEPLTLRLPGPRHLVEKRFVTPPTYAALRESQVALIDRYADYILGADRDLALAVVSR